MSSVPYVVNVDVYICSELEEIRAMLKTHDFSALAATVERIQHHANRMEAALHEYKNRKWDIDRCLQSEFSDREKIRKIEEIINVKKLSPPNWVEQLTVRKEPDV